MKKGLLSLVLVTSTFCCAFSQSESFCDSTGCVGDIKYSILKPGVFTKRYPGWVLLDGGSSIETDSIFKVSKLYNLLKVPSLPDARGVFLRGMNEGRSIETGNPDGDKPVGTRQSDEFETHDHEIFAGVDNQRRRIMASLGWAGGWGGVGNVSPVHAERVPNSVHESGMIKILGRGEAIETRPRNIVLYIYIKVN